MTELEQKDPASAQCAAQPENGRIEPCVRYDDEFYEKYVQDFRRCQKRKLFFRIVKRAFDFCFALFLLVLLLPVMLLISLAILLDSRGPILFKQQRVGKNGKPFCCYKFRTMKRGAPRDLPSSQVSAQEGHVTRVGSVLRRWSLDELPQLFCCLVGTMSFIGPRPLVLSEVNCHRMREELGVYRMRPGITGLAQVSGRDNVYYKNKAILDAQYVRDASLGMDIRLLALTVAVVLTGTGNDISKKKK